MKTSNKIPPAVRFPEGTILHPGQRVYRHTTSGTIIEAHPYLPDTYRVRWDNYRAARYGKLEGPIGLYESAELGADSRA